MEAEARQLLLPWQAFQFKSYHFVKSQLSLSHIQHGVLYITA